MPVPKSYNYSTEVELISFCIAPAIEGHDSSPQYLQAINNLTASLAARGIAVVTSEGAPLHIDHLNMTDAQGLIAAAAKSYVDWYMLTQVGVPGPLALAPV